MKFSLTTSFLCLVATPIRAISLLQVLQSYSDLSSLSGYVNASANATALLANANNFTFLAASNEAIAKFATQNSNALAEDVLLATVQYALLKGGYPSLSFSETPQFASSNLVNGSYANVTGGQAMELVMGSSGSLNVISGNKSVSTAPASDIVCNGGIVHIIDTVPSIPISAVSEITAANLQYFVSILNAGGFLNTANTYVNQVLEIPDITYFIPNSAAALSNATALVKSSSAADSQALFEYHVVPGMVAYSNSLTNGTTFKTAQGENVTVTVQDGETYINAARVIDSDYIVANGVVHVIDNLLNPNDTSGPPPATSTPSSTGSSATSTHSPVSDASTSHKSNSTTIGIAVGVSVGGALLVAAIAFFIFRRSRKLKKAAPTASNRDSQSTASLGGEKGRNIYVQQGYDVQRGSNNNWNNNNYNNGNGNGNGSENGNSNNVSPNGSPTSTSPLRVETMGINQFQSMHVEDIGGPEYVPYVPPKSPNRMVVRGQDSFF